MTIWEIWQPPGAKGGGKASNYMAGGNDLCRRRNVSWIKWDGKDHIIYSGGLDKICIPPGAAFCWWENKCASSANRRLQQQKRGGGRGGRKKRPGGDFARCCLSRRAAALSWIWIWMQIKLGWSAAAKRAMWWNHTDSAHWEETAEKTKRAWGNSVGKGWKTKAWNSMVAEKTEEIGMDKTQLVR